MKRRPLRFRHAEYSQQQGLHRPGLRPKHMLHCIVDRTLVDD
jgi:hypothetical protein